MRHIVFLILLAVCCAVSAPQVAAQIIREGPTAGDSTTEGLDGLTTEGLNANTGTEDSAFPGAGPDSGFVGASAEDGFVGGVRESTTNNTVNRLFRAITGGDVPTGGTQETTGNPRRVPVSLRLGFTAPSPREATALAGPGQVALKRYLPFRPEFLTVAVAMDDAGVVTLSGTVSETSTKRLAANLVRLQPGVRKIQNQVVVQTPAAAEQ